MPYFNMKQTDSLSKRNSTFSGSDPLMAAYNPRVPLGNCVVVDAAVVVSEEIAALGI